MYKLYLTYLNFNIGICINRLRTTISIYTYLFKRTIKFLKYFYSTTE